MQRRTCAALLAAGLLFTGACGGDDGETSSGDSGESSDGGGEGGGGDICAAYEAMDANADAQELEAQFAAVDPPAEIADAWQTIVEADIDDPAAADAYAEVGQYVMEECYGGAVPTGPGSVPSVPDGM